MTPYVNYHAHEDETITLNLTELSDDKVVLNIEVRDKESGASHGGISLFADSKEAERVVRWIAQAYHELESIGRILDEPINFAESVAKPSRS